ncbi:MAG: acyl-CoA synthetase [Actinobacteria bacterium]|nr:acyl-CoA synthetase [Actinomycetota bacterium]
MEYQLSELFESIVDHIPDRTALVCADADGEVTSRRTYRELDERANQLAHALSAAGIGKGDHVGCHITNGHEYVEMMLACFKISAVPVNVNYRYVEGELRYLYDNADLKGLLFGGQFAQRVSAVADDIDTLELFIVSGEPDGDVPDGTREYEAFLAGGSSERDFTGRSGDDIWLLYTGGTTGMPKGVMWRHEDVFFAGMGGGNPVAEPVSSPEELHTRIDNSEGAFQLAMFAAPPLMHGAAQLGTFIGFWGGSKVCLIEKYSGHGALTLIRNEGVNTISLVGDAMAVPLIEALAEGDYDTSSLFVISSAGAILSKTVRERLNEAIPSGNILDSFGSSETGYSGSEAEGSSPDEGLKFNVTERTAVITDDHRVVDPGSDDIGRVAQRGHIPLGYYNDEDKTAETFPVIDDERWVLTGDYATVDTDGVIHVMGRGSVCINSGGEKIYPEEVEAALKAHPAIVDAIVAGIPDETWGERVGAVVQVSSGQQAPSPEDIEAHLADRVARYKVPRALAIVDEVVRSPAGKPDYKWARAVLAEA